IPTGTDAGAYTVYYKVIGDSNHVDIEAKGVSVTIAKAEPEEIIFPTAGGITYGEALSASELTGGSGDGTFAWSDPDTVPTVENSGYTVTFTPNDTANYDYSNVTLTQTVTITVSKAASGVAAVPTANTLTYTGSSQELVSAGEATGGTMKYCLTESGEYAETIPTGTDAGAYTVYYKVVGDSNHADSEAASMSVTIAKAAPGVTAPTANTLKYTKEAQELVTAGEASGGTMYYSLTGDSDWSTEIPTGTDVGDYTVYYKVIGDSNHTDTEAASVSVTISKKKSSGSSSSSSDSDSSSDSSSSSAAVAPESAETTDADDEAISQSDTQTAASDADSLDTAQSDTDATQNETDATQSNTDTDATQRNTDALQSDTADSGAQELSQEEEEEQTVQSAEAVVEDGRLEAAGATSGSVIATGNISGAAASSTRLEVGDGSVTVTVLGEADKLAAGVEDTVAFANAVLTSGQIEMVGKGADVAIQLDLNVISGEVPDEDRELIENALEEYKANIPGLVIGAYIDISLRVDDGDGVWSAVTQTGEPIEIVIEIPDDIKGLSDEYYIIRLHEGECALLSDTDDDAETLTISSNLFSTYAIAYVSTESAAAVADTAPAVNEENTGFAWIVLLAVMLAAAAIGVVWIIFLYRKKSKKD
ncbi:MAG: hypothetical protein LUE96_06290, partial [Lachnospiraceae bacterium]|nr:hypothetical protein [Lachnospiraceae bacterium]